MENLIYLGIALGIFVLGSLVLAIRHRERPITFDSSIDRFRSEMGALDPRRGHGSRRRGRR